MPSVQEVADMVGKVKGENVKRNFTQSLDLILAFKDIDLKKQPLSLNESVFLPHPPAKKASVCVFASGDLALRARRAGADRVIEPEEMDRGAAQKREVKKIAGRFDFFLADVSLMPKVGKSLGQYLGPRGKMPAPVPPNAPIESLIERYRAAVRIRSKSQLSAGCRVGDENMADVKVAENALAVLGAVEKKLPNGLRNIRSMALKPTMGKPMKTAV